MKKINKIVFVLTAECLHRCKYCFDRAYYPIKTINYTAEDVKAFLDLNKEYLEDDLEIFIQGGDIFLAPNLDSILETLYNYDHPNIMFRFLLSTLPVEMLARYPILNTAQVGISIDGPRHVHNLNRKRIDGKNSFDEVEYLLYMKQLSNLCFQSVISSNNIRFIHETEAFFKKHGVNHSYAIDRRNKYWTKESLELLKILPVPGWGTGSYHRFTFSEEAFENYYKKYIVFADGSINLFGNEFMPSHELKYFCNITERKPLAPLFKDAVKDLNLCRRPCNNCDKRCKKYSVISDLTAGHTNDFMPRGPNLEQRAHIMKRMAFLDPETMERTTLKENFLTAIPFDKDIPSQLVKGE